MKYLLIILSIVAFSAQAQKIPPGKYKTNITVNDSIIPVIITVDSSTDIKTDYPYSGPTKKMLSFSFPLTASATVSAGVYKGDLLVRTLFSNKQYEAGKHDEAWELLTDNLDTIKSVESLTVKVLSSQVKSEWLGVIGNTSDSMTGGTVHHNYNAINGMAFAGDYGYYTVGQNERKQSYNKFNIKTPNKRIVITNKRISATGVATDGNLVYWAANDAYAPTYTMVFATKCSDDSEALFYYGTSYTTRTIASTFPSVINLTNSNSLILGIAVQKKGNLLFVSRENQLDILNKTTGALIKSIVLPISGLSIDANDNIWTIVDNKVKHYSIVGSDITELFTLDAFVHAASLAVHNDTLLVTDNYVGVINAFDTTGKLLFTVGRGGYENDPGVFDDKFYWADKRITYTPLLAFQPDGSYWVGDDGNTRVQHFIGEKYLNNIAYRPASYSTYTDKNNPERVFSDYCEYEVDYKNLSWKLVKNWGYPVTYSVDDPFGRLADVATLSNGKTYALGIDKGVVVTGGRVVKSIWELPATGNLRRAGTFIGANGNYKLHSDGSLRYTLSSTYYYIAYKKSLTGFTNGNPIWGNPELLASIVLTDKIPSSNLARSAGETTSSGILIGYEGTDSRLNSYHLAGIKNNKILWLTARPTHKNYKGDFPTDGAFDIGNGIVRSGDVKHHAIDHFILYGQHGEFWKSSQTNQWNLYYDNGLLINHFGVSGPDVSDLESPAGMAGNVMTGSAVMVDGDIYLSHNDENYHSGVHLWRISNLNSVDVKEYAVALSDIPIDTNTIDLMSNWVRMPAANVTGWAVRYGIKTYDKFSSTDISPFFKMSTVSTASISKDIGNYNLNKWSIEGDLNYDGNYPNRGNYGGQYFEVLDSLGGVILRLVIKEDNSNTTSIIANDTYIANGQIDEIKKVLSDFQHLKLSYSGGLLTFKLGDYDAKKIVSNALIKSPKTIRFYFWNQSFSRDRVVSIKDLKFIK